MLHKGDKVVDPTKTVMTYDAKATDYPFGLDEAKVVKLISFFGARKAQKEYATKQKGAGRPSEKKEKGLYNVYEKEFLTKAGEWFDIKVASEEDMRKLMVFIVPRFKVVLSFLRSRPAFVTSSIYKALDIGGYRSYLNSVVMVVDKKGEMRPRVLSDSQKNSNPPLARLEVNQWELQSMAMDKMMLIMQSITAKDVKKSNLGIKSKALRDIYSMYHMSRIQNKSPNLTLVNVNIDKDSPESKLTAYSAYIQKNRENNG